MPHNILADASKEVKTVQVAYEGKVRGCVYYVKTFEFTAPQFVNFLEQNGEASFLTVDAKQKNTTYVIQKVDSRMTGTQLQQMSKQQKNSTKSICGSIQQIYPNSENLVSELSTLIGITILMGQVAATCSFRMEKIRL